MPILYQAEFFPKYLNGDNIISVALNEEERIKIGYILNEKQELSGVFIIIQSAFVF